MRRAAAAPLAVLGIILTLLALVAALGTSGGANGAAPAKPTVTVTVPGPTSTVTATTTATVTATATVTEPGPTVTSTVTAPGPTTTVTVPGPTTTVTSTVTATATQTVTETVTATPSVTPTDPPASAPPLMGVSASSNGTGGTLDWDSFRVYTETTLYQVSNRAEPNRPKAVLYSKTGSPLGGSNPSYATVYNEVLGDLTDYYYNADGTRSSRWGIDLYWSNGNEMHNKGVLFLDQSAAAGAHTQTQIDGFTRSQSALYDAIHAVQNGQRRFPDAHAGSDPTTEAERSGWVAEWLHATIQYHDFVAWSIYPAGRKDTEADPTFNWPSTDPAQSQVAPHGYMVRCFERVRLATLAGGLPMGSVALHVGETGTGDDPDDSTTRPYWAVHGFMHPLVTISENMGIPLGTVNWWDSQVDASSPQNILLDEPSTTNPSTRQAWQGWATYDHLRGGTHPSSWAGNPKASWKTTGTVQ